MTSTNGSVCMEFLGWSDFSGVEGGDGSVVLAKLHVSGGALIVAASVSINKNLCCQLHLHGRMIPPEYVPAVTLDSVGAVRDFIVFVSRQSVCPGNPDMKFQSLLKARKGKFLDSSGMLHYILVSVLFE